MNDLINILHDSSNLTNADMFSIFILGSMMGAFLSDGCHALINFIFNKIKNKKGDK